MASERSRELYQLLCKKGVPDDLSREIAYRQMNTDYTAPRMIGYLYGHEQLRVEDIVDEMLAIMSDRDGLVKKHEMEAAQAKINEMYQNGV